jgi:hypothetical protein
MRRGGLKEGVFRFETHAKIFWVYDSLTTIIPDDSLYANRKDDLIFKAQAERSYDVPPKIVITNLDQDRGEHHQRLVRCVEWCPENSVARVKICKAACYGKGVGWVLETHVGVKSLAVVIP